METPKKVLTRYHPKLIDTQKADQLYEYLKNNIEWEEGIRSKKGFTRLAKALDLGCNEQIDNIIAEVFSLLDIDYIIDGIYLNYYKDGTHFTPSHAHKGTVQLIISLGATRTLDVGKKKFEMSSGDVIIFGGSAHGVPKDISCKSGRISIATFMHPKLEPTVYQDNPEMKEVTLIEYLRNMGF